MLCKRGRAGLSHPREICSLWPGSNFDKTQVAHAQKTSLTLTAKISEDLVLTEHLPASLSSQIITFWGGRRILMLDTGVGIGLASGESWTDDQYVSLTGLCE